MKIPFGSSFSLHIHEEGHIYLMISGGITLISAMFFGINSATVALLFATLGVAAFFRDPDRIVPDKKNAVISPADGRIVSIDNGNPPSELTSMIDSESIKISIFLSVFDVHVNRIPVAGKIIDVKYHPGKFLNASLDKSSSDNERNTITIQTENNDIIHCVQIAGLVARRIVCDASIGDLYSVGDRYGIIRFGSRVDVYLPKKYKINVSVGQTMIGGETIIAELI